MAFSIFDFYKKTKWLLLTIIYRIGYFDILWLTLFVLVVLVFVNVITPLRYMSDNLEAQLIKSREENKINLNSKNVDLSNGVSSLSPLQEFYDFLPKNSKNIFFINKIHDLATNNRIAINQVKYSSMKTNHLSINVLVIHMEATGRLFDIRLFIHHILKEIPTLSIRNLTINKNTDDTQKISLEMALYNSSEVKNVSQ